MAKPKKRTADEDRKAEIEEKKKELIEYARSTGDVDLALVATGYKDPWEFLGKVTREDTGKSALGNGRETLGSRLSANQRRRRELELWLRTESLEPYRAYYARELELIEECQIQAIYDLLIDADYLRPEARDAQSEEKGDAQGKQEGDKAGSATRAGETNGAEG